MSKTDPRSSVAPSIPQLPPPPYQMGLLPHYVRHASPIALSIRRHRVPFLPDDFTIKDAVTRQRIFAVRAQFLSLSRRKTLNDHADKPLFEICSMSGTFRKSFDGYQYGNRRANLFIVKKAGLFNPKLEISFTNHVADGRQEKLVLRGRWLSRDAEITTQAGVVVAKISREYSFCECRQLGARLMQAMLIQCSIDFLAVFAVSSQTYGVVIAPGVDAALIAAICVCLDEAYNDGKSGQSGASAAFSGGC
jgi:uncharacterized protein YxjI